MDSIDITRERALELGREFIGGHFDRLTVDDIRITVCGGGYCSRLYICENISSNNNKNEMNKFLIRLYGGKAIGEDSPLVTLNTESQILMFYAFGERGLGPKLLGSFTGGRLEEFIPSHTCGSKDLEDSNIRKQIARNLARYHNANLPLSLKKFDYYGYIDACYDKFYTDEGRQWFVETCRLAKIDPAWGLDADFRAEMDWIKKTEPKVPSRHVLSNNDMNRNNILILDKPKPNGENVMIIDYELSSNNPRGLDLGHHFAMWLADFGRKDGPNGHFVSDMDYPSDEIRREFIEEYLNETKKCAKLCAKFELDPDLDSVEHLEMEAEFYGLKIVHFWISDLSSPKPKGDPFDEPSVKLGFIAIAERFFKLYLERKAIFIKKYKL